MIILATKYYERVSKNFSAKNLFNNFDSFFSPPIFSSNFTTNTSISYQMSLLLLPMDPGTCWTQTAEPWVVGPLSYPLDFNERIILILKFPDAF